MKSWSQRIRKGAAALGITAAFALTAACAPMPQTVTLDADPEVDSGLAGDNQSIALRVQDRRSMDILGYRDRERGVAVTSEPSVEKGIEQGLTKALEAQGYVVERWDEDADRRLDVKVNRFEYERTGGFFRRFTTVTAEMYATSYRGDRRHRAEVSSSTTDQAFLFGPSARKNQELVDSVLNRSVSRIVSEREVMRLLEGDD